MLGWTVLNHLKQNPETRHVPVQILTLDQDRSHALASGAFSYVAKPVTSEALDQALSRIRDFAAPRRKRLLVVEDNPAEQLSKYRWHNTGGTIPVAQYRWHNTGGTIPVAQYRWHNTGGTIPVAQYRWHNTGGTIPVAQYRWHNTGGTIPVAQ